MRTTLVATALALGLALLVGCEPDAPKAAGQGGSPPPVDSNADQKKAPRPAKPGGLVPPKRGGIPG